MAGDVKQALAQLRDQWEKSPADLAGFVRKSVTLRRKLAKFRESLQPSSRALTGDGSGGVHQSPQPVKPQPTGIGTERPGHGKSSQEQTEGTRPEHLVPNPAMMIERAQQQRRRELSQKLTQAVKEAEDQLMSLDEQAADLKSDPRRIRQMFDDLDHLCFRMAEVTSEK